ncbi:2,3-diketo-L-gulonate-binding periplasmic protein yiaO [uncultured Alphaproteobacteria bacterium]|uniref:2,3-diketo-L-gulonate-binding periplasmic protein yiaO n=1 Tax=uncultured Alphaproteobacteria bacterium TaxID=91750 RepID=A0A212J1Y5_9PROT|nr:2,3-diketo-L-gulonate-binding periplasmic protein yiaO [uncultured Alphaproteobacteria bacterium]
MHHPRKLAVAALAVASFFAASPAVAADYKAEYTVSTVLPAPFPWGIAADKWVDLVKERTQGRITLKIYSNSQLVSGDQTKEFAAMRQGIIDMAVGSTINWSPQVKELNLFSMPFLMPDYAAMDRITQGPVGKELFEILRKRGVEPLAWAENGFRQVTNSKHEIHTPADLAGLKIRVVGSPLYNDIFTALGANPTQMSWADAKPALTTKAVDGQENPISVFKIAKIATVGQQYMTRWNYVNDPLIFAVNKRVWESFTPEDQKILRQAAIDAGAYGIKASREGDEAALKEIKAEGVTVTELTPAERARFVEKTRGVYADWAKKIGPDLVKAAEKAVAAKK